MNINPVGIAVPIFFLLMALEFFSAWWQKKSIYRINDTVANLGCGIGDQLIGIFTKLFTVGIYAWFFEHYAILQLNPQNPWVWGAGFVLVDFCYYWYHRESHLVALFWATHSVHHQSEEYNLAVALRQSWFAKFFSWIFYIPLAIIGFSPLIFVLSYSINLFYQFWIHTKLIDRMGPFEWVFNSPSHHRVHHGTNERYLDKNYAGVFIVWDRIFGSFQEELPHDPPVYGVLAPVASWNPIKTNVYPLKKLFIRAYKAPSWWLALNTLIQLPGWSHPSSPHPTSKVYGYNQDHKESHIYAGIQFSCVTIAMTLILTFSEFIAPWFLIPAVLCTILVPITISGYLERKKWAVPLEGMRVSLFLALLFINPYPSTKIIGILVGVIGVLSFVVFGRKKHSTRLAQ